MKAILFFILVFTSTISFGQVLKFKIIGQSDTTIHLVKYYGSKLYYADTAEIKNGSVQFDGSKQKGGILALLLPGQKMLQFVYNNEEVQIESNVADIMGMAKVKKSAENKVFIEYVKFMNNERIKTDSIIEKRKSLSKESEDYKSLSAKIDEANKKVKDYQLNLIKSNSDLLVSKIVKMSMDVEVPESPKDESGNIIDSNFRFFYFRQHYFDNIDLQDDRLMRTPIFSNKFEYYFSKNMMIQHWDTVIYYAYDFCDRLNQKSELFQYCVTWITSSYEKSNIMGMDKVFVYMGQRYYCTMNGEGKSPAFWMTDEKLDKLCEKVNTNINLVMGAIPPNIRLVDTTDVVWHDFMSIDAEYTIIYFWDPECGHCKKITPKMQTLYAEKFKDRNIEIFAVGKAVGEDFENWKEFIHDNNLEFINVGLTDRLFREAKEDPRKFVPKYTTIEALNYSSTYDIFATPKVFVLDKDKKIIAKGISVSQLEDLLDRLQDKKDAPKLFPMEEENLEEDQMH